ncbi:MAG: ATP-binding protein [Deltaproteobacteria bacterium]|nr:ATP-binding protein [Deltaproteobacteria bacterium]
MASTTIEQRMRAQLPAGIISVDLAGDVVVADGAGVLLGLAPDEVRGRSAFQVFSAFPAVLAAFRQALDGGTATATFEAQGARWDLRVTPTRDEGGELEGALGWAIRRDASEERARSNLWFLDAVVENIPDMIFVKDAAELRFVRFNRAGEELLGYRRDELLGRNDYDFFPRAEADWFTSKDRSVLNAGKLLDVEEEIHTRLKGARTLHTKKIPIYDDDGQPLYLLGISEDITERKLMETERQELYERIRELDRFKSRLVANVSHELRTPLALIQAFVSRLMRTKGSSTLERADLESIGGNVQAVLGLVNDLLDAARSEAGTLVADYADVDVGELVRLVASSFQVVAAEKQVTFVIDTEPVQAQVDSARLQRMVANLVANALRHTPAGGRVRCAVPMSSTSAAPAPRGPPRAAAVEAKGEFVRIEVADSGPGIPLAMRDRVFERFFQIDDATTRAGGAGLGLAIVKEFAELQHGVVFVDQAPEGGARFVIELPLRAPPGVSVSAAPAVVVAAAPRRPPQIAPRQRDTGPLVLVVEDNPELNRFLVDTLAVDFKVATAHDGEEGLKMALALMPDLILSDLMMPRMSGDQLVREVRLRRELDDVSIIVLTANADEELRTRLLREGAQDYVSKPFDTGELVARVGNLLALKSVRDVLQRELETTRQDVAQLALELARRLRELQTEVKERERAEAAIRYLADASILLSESLDYPRTLRQCARLAVPHVADWCVVDLVEEDGSVSRATAHADPAADVVMRDLAERRPGPGEPSLLSLVADMDGQPRLLADLDELLPALEGGEDRFDLVRKLAPRSIIVTSVTARGRVLGAMVVGSTHRAYGPADLALVGELARRAALAIDNARLHRDAQTAIGVRDEFLSIASHELRTPLTPLRVTLEALQQRSHGPANDREPAMLDVALRQVERLTRLVEELLETSRIDAGRLVLEPIELDLKVLVERVVARFQPVIARSGSTIDVQAEPLVGRWDRARLEHVVLNLLSNATKFGAGKPIVVRVEAAGGVDAPSARLVVRDHGIGLDPARLERIFERFERAVSPMHYGGLGLGLYVCRRIVEAHGGTIAVESKLGEGATFTVILPLSGT